MQESRDLYRAVGPLLSESKCTPASTRGGRPSAPVKQRVNPLLDSNERIQKKLSYSLTYTESQADVRLTSIGEEDESLMHPTAQTKSSKL